MPNANSHNILPYEMETIQKQITFTPLTFSLTVVVGIWHRRNSSYGPSNSFYIQHNKHINCWYVGKGVYLRWQTMLFSFINKYIQWQMFNVNSLNFPPQIWTQPPRMIFIFGVCGLTEFILKCIEPTVNTNWKHIIG